MELATRFNGEVVNGDAMQMYAGIPVITNKIPEHERNAILHHLLGTVSLHEPPRTVPSFVQESQKIIREIRSRGKLPILVGGSHYYTQALLLKESLVAKDRYAGKELEEEEVGENKKLQQWPVLDAPTSQIYTKLQEVDPEIAQRWHPSDRRKIRRSLEICLQTGRKASDIYADQQRRQTEDKEDGDEAGMRYATLVLWLESRDDVLHERLNHRVEQMIVDGLNEEIVSLDNLKMAVLADGNAVDTSKGIFVSIGYKEMKPYVDALRNETLTNSVIEKLKLDCIEATKTATRQYAKRQKRWIRIRMANALRDANAVSHFYLLDSSDLDAWESNVTETACRLATSFLAGDALPEPRSLSTLAEECLPELGDDLNQRQAFSARTCEVCNKVMMTEGEWQRHLASNRHKKALFGTSKRERRDVVQQGHSLPNVQSVPSLRSNG